MIRMYPFSVRSLAAILLSIGIVTTLAKLSHAQPAERVWTDTSGKYSTTATLVSGTGTEVLLENAHGKKARIPLAKLCADDQAYVAEQAATLRALGESHYYGREGSIDYDRAAQLFHEAARFGDGRAMAWFGQMLGDGTGLAKNREEALRWYKTGMLRGDGVAAYLAGLAYRNGQGTKKNTAEENNCIGLAEEYCRQAASRGDGRAMQVLGALYEFGLGLPKDGSQAASWYLQAAEAGDPVAMADLTYIYMDGIGVTKDEVLAFMWAKKGAEAGSPDAMHRLGAFYVDGEIVSQNLDQGVTWLRLAASANNARAKFALGHCLKFGIGMAKDFEQAFQYFLKAAEGAETTAYAFVAECYHFAEGTEKDLAKAIHWYKKAANSGDMESMVNLGMCYADQGNFRDAVSWWEQAAAGGEPQAMYNLGVVYSQGKPGVQPNPAVGWDWFQQSAAAGHQLAQQAISRPAQQFRPPAFDWSSLMELGWNGAMDGFNSSVEQGNDNWRLRNGY